MTTTTKTRDPVEESVGCALLFASLPFTLAYGTVLAGYVLSVIWGWFMVPLLHAPPLSVAGAAGIHLVIRYVTYQTPKPDDDGAMAALKKIPGQMVLTAVLAGMTLLIGYVIHAWWLA